VTYKKVANPKGGRRAMPLPPALLAQLQHSAATGARCTIDIGPDDGDALAELRRALVRAGYTHYADKTIRTRKTATQFSYWVTAKVGKTK